MTSVFLSYSSHDREVAKTIKEWLSLLEIDVFIDYQQLLGGDHFPERLAKEIERRDSLLFLVSENSLKSRWVNREIHHADRHGKRIIPVRIDMTPYPSGIALVLGDTHYLDFSQLHKDFNQNEAIEKLAETFGVNAIVKSNSVPDMAQITFENADVVRELRTITEPKSYPSSLAFSYPGNLLAASYGNILLSRDGRGKGYVKVWKLTTGELIASFHGHRSDVQAVEFALSGIEVASASLDGAIRIVKIASKRTRILTQNQPIAAIAFANLDQTVYAGLLDGKVLAWDIKLRKSERIHKFENPVETLTASKRGLVAIGSENRVAVWDNYKGRVIVEYEAHDAKVRSLRFSPDERILASCSDDRTIRLWDTTTWTEIFKLNGHHHYVRSISFSPDGKLLASGSNDGTVRLWDLQKQKQVNVLTNHMDAILAVEFSPDSTLLASASFDKSIRFWGIIN